LQVAGHVQQFVAKPKPAEPKKPPTPLAPLFSFEEIVKRNKARKAAKEANRVKTKPKAPLTAAKRYAKILAELKKGT